MFQPGLRSHLRLNWASIPIRRSHGWLLAVLRSLRVSVSFLSSDHPPLLAAWPSHMAVQSVATSFFIVSKRVSSITVVTVSCNIIFPCAHHLCCILLVRRKSQVLFVIDLLLCGSTVEEWLFLKQGFEHSHPLPHTLVCPPTALRNKCGWILTIFTVKKGHLLLFHSCIFSHHPSPRNYYISLRLLSGFHTACLSAFTILWLRMHSLIVTYSCLLSFSVSPLHGRASSKFIT